MKKAIVMEIQDGKATVMQTGGHFLSVKAQAGWQVGDVITMQSPRISTRKIAGVAASFFIVVFLGITGYNLYFSPVTLISMDINPSIELSINRFNHVVSVKSYNQDGQAIIDNLPLKNKDYDAALKLLFQDKGFQSYLKKNNDMVFSVKTAGSKDQQSILNNLKSIVPQDGPETSYFKVNEDTVKEAHSHQITAGKYMKIMELKASDPNTSVKQYKNKSISHICGEIKKHNGHGDQKGKKNHDSKKKKKNHDSQNGNDNHGSKQKEKGSSHKGNGRPHSKGKHD